MTSSRRKRAVDATDEMSGEILSSLTSSCDDENEEDDDIPIPPSQTPLEENKEDTS